jgi:peptidoglycan hydrolase FlgJ
MSSSIAALNSSLPQIRSQVPSKAAATNPGDAELRQTFDSFVGEVFFGQMLDSMRKTVDKAPYFNGGRAEEMFTQQLDQVLSEQMTKASASEFTGPMFDLFMLNRS